MDSQTIVGVSGGVSNLLLYDAPSLTPQDLSVALNRAVSDNTAKIISMSIGGNELTFGVAAKQLMDEIFQEGIAQGQTFVISSGDNGVYSRANANKLFHQDQGEQPILDTNVEAAQLANYSVQYPASSPYVISVGATTLYTRFNSQYVEEVPMNWWYNYTYLGRNTAPRLQRNESSQIWDTVWASGGGISHFENAPAWQQHVNGGSRMRTVPDVSLDGDPQSGVFVIEQGKRIQYGGTSLSAPILAGFLARLQTQNKNRLGFPARGLYTAFSGLDRFALLNEVKLAGANGTGNGVTWNGVNYGYPLTTGFNSVSGLGSINVGNLANYINANPALFK
ncbi:S8 family serine peptidase [Burkholderia sp. 22PA0106]|uniref:S53 family peptidase n=1 Tax=Burkholderia sp. 22PA0106 TaxID=3237371 RepID=UPI0039C2FF90